jgi:hypothetical protein
MMDALSRVARRVLFSVGLWAAVGCGGASSSDLLSADASGVDASLDTGPSDVFSSPDVMQRPETVADVAPKEAAAVDTAPVDTGPPPLPGVTCGATSCAVPGGDCCIVVNDAGEPSYECQTPLDPSGCRDEGGSPVECDQGADCPGEQCCGLRNENQTAYLLVACTSKCGPNEILFCNPSSSTDVAACAALGGTCNESELLPGLYVCQ